MNQTQPSFNCAVKHYSSTYPLLIDNKKLCVGFFFSILFNSSSCFPAIIVYDTEKGYTWRTSHPAMHPDQSWAMSDILGENFTLADGIIGLALDPETSTLYFQPYATDRYLRCFAGFYRFLLDAYILFQAILRIDQQSPHPAPFKGRPSSQTGRA
jgi:Major royal jelly protein